VVVDLPGLYSLDSQSPDEKLASDALQGKLEHTAPDAALVVVDATNLERNLFLASQVLELKCPVVVALNMMDMARRDGIRIDVAKLRDELGCVVVPVSARTGKGIDELKLELNRLVAGAMPEAVDHVDPHCARLHRLHVPGALRMDGANFHARHGRRHHPALEVDGQAGRLFYASRHRRRTFLAVMLALFALIFWAAQIPMAAD
jgi:ferrous iron transport protein B